MPAHAGIRPEALLPAVVQAALRAGQAIMAIYARPEDVAVSHKADASPLTLADRRSHGILHEALTALGPPSLPVLSEEGRAIPYETRKRWAAFWLVDPLDGTKEFIKKNGDFTVNIALIMDNQPVLGVVHVPARHTLYFGGQTSGAHKITGPMMLEALCTDAITPGGLIQKAEAMPAGQALRTEILRNDADQRLVAASRSHMNRRTAAFVEDYNRKTGRPSRLLPVGSALKLCMVADGVADIYPRLGPTMEWDIAAGHAIINGAGRKVLKHDGSAGGVSGVTAEELRYNKADLRNPWFVAQ